MLASKVNFFKQFYHRISLAIVLVQVILLNPKGYSAGYKNKTTNFDMPNAKF